MLRNFLFVVTFVLLSISGVFLFVALGEIFAPDFLDWLTDGPKEKLVIRSAYIYLIFFHTPIFLSLFLSLIAATLIFKKKKASKERT